MRIGLVGAGRQGWRRASALANTGDDSLAMVADQDLALAQRLANRFGGEATGRWEAVLERPDIEAVVVCTPPPLHAQISIAALERSKHVLCEKPTARSPEEARTVLAAAGRSRATFKAGFNHRHHPGIQQLKAWCDEGRLGALLLGRCRYGMVGRPGYGSEWRGRSELTGGGELMDQGLHVLDLFRWFLGDFGAVTGMISRSYWREADVEDNAFALLRTAGGQVASLHVSWTQWRNLFSFEVIGTEGYGTVEGLGGSYGTERAASGRRDFSAPFSETTVDFRGEDRSWEEEWREFGAAIRAGRQPLGSIEDAVAAIALAAAIYRADRERREIGTSPSPPLARGGTGVEPPLAGGGTP